MTESKVSIEEATKMSLDDYINASGVVDRSNIPSATSVQWRLKNPFRPTGMSPLVPLVTNKKFHNNNFNWNQRRKHMSNNWYDRDAPSSYPHGINRNNQPNFKPQNRHNYNMLRDVAHNAVLSGVPTGGMSTSVVPFNQQQQAMASLASVGAQLLSTPADYMDIAKIFIDKMAEIQKSRVNKPKYDMKVQKEISEIQGKTLYYSCTDGSPKVISSDGPGVDDCQIRVNTTEMTMNQRFS